MMRAVRKRPTNLKKASLAAKRKMVAKEVNRVKTRPALSWSVTNFVRRIFELLAATCRALSQLRTRIQMCCH